jgi:hypothetical protein
MNLEFSKGICDGSVANFSINGKPYGFQMDVRLNYYRGLFLSCIDEFGVVVDGEAVDPLDLTFSINDKDFSVFNLNEKISEFWNVLHKARISAKKPGGLSVGQYEIKLILILRSPYLPRPGGEDHNYVPIQSGGTVVVMI